tara:strand:- start:4409 stop:5011 length:603 start_codon:yes stop_codon:yes gene_type:complete
MPNASGICTLFIKASYTAIPATMPLHTHGSVAASGTPYAIMPLFVAEGMESTGTNDSITLFIRQGEMPSGVMPLYTYGSLTGGVGITSTMSLFAQQGLGPSGLLNLYVKGLGVTTHVDSGLGDSNGFYFSSDSIPLMIEREYEATTATTKLFIEGQQTRTTTGFLPLHTITPSGSPTANLNLCLNTGSPDSELNLYTRGY